MKLKYLILISLIFIPYLHSFEKITIYYSDYDPFIFKDYSGELTGFEYDILSSFCKRYDLQCDYVSTTFEGLLNCVKDGRCDIAAGSIYVTEERKKYGNFSTPHLKSGLVAVVPYQFDGDLDILYRERVGVKRNATGHRFAIKLKKNNPSLEVNIFDSTFDSFKALEYGYIDWLMNDYYNSLNLIYTRFRGKFKILSIGKRPIYFEKSDIAFYLPLKNRKLLDLLNRHILELKKENKIENLIDKWFYITKPLKLKDFYLFVVIILFLVVVVITVFLFFLFAFRSNRKLRAYNSFLKALVDTPTVLVFAVDSGKKITFWNKGIEIVTGFKMGEITFDKLMEDVDDEFMQKCLRSRKPFEDNIFIINTKKGKRTILFDIYPVFYKDLNCLFFGIDLTDTLDTINSKLLYENLYYAIVDASPNGIIMYDGVNVFVNNNIKTWLGVSSKTLSIDELKDIKLGKLITKFSNSGKVREILYDVDDLIEGLIFDVHYIRIEMVDKNYHVFILIDNTSRVKQHRILQEVQKNEIVSNIVNGVVHDVNNLLSVIVNYISILNYDEYIKDRYSDIITKITDVADQSSSFLKSLLNLSHITSEKKLIFIDNFLESKKHFFSQLLGKGIEFKLEILRRGGVLELNEERFTQVLLNLILNARDAVESNGKIVLRKDFRGNEVVIEIEDNGRGIPEDLFDKIFEPFFTTKGKNGTGMGLYVTKIFVEESGGRISVGSKLGVGTKFTIFLPTKDKY